MDYLDLQGRFDRPQLLATGGEQELKLLLQIAPRDVLRNLEGGIEVGTNVCLLFDVSQSMEEGDKLNAAINAGRELVNLADGRTVVSIVAFDEQPYLLAESQPATDRAALLEALEGLRSVGGGMTNISAGLNAAIDQIQQVDDDGQARVIILLSDGEDNICKPDAIQAAVRLAEADIQLFAVGMSEDYEADFLKALVTPSNGSLFGHTDVQRVKEAFIDLAVTLANVVATQAVLQLRFTDDVLVGKGYKASPDQLFLGNTRLLEDRSHRRRVGNIERNKQYAFLYTLRIPTRGIGARPVLTATLSFDVPALGVQRAIIERTFACEYTRDAAVAEQQDGTVLECFRRVEITELVERFVEAHNSGVADDTARYLQLLIQKYDDVNDQRMVNHYRKIQNNLLDGGQITRAMINTSVVASTVVRGGGDLPVLIDDDF